ncbi:MAG: hypothetical protein ABL958_19260 [Bdellovibrionia bacterium]
MDSLLATIKAQDPTEVVRLLEGKNVRLTLTLSSGSTMTGVPVRTETHRGVSTLLMQSVQNNDDIMFLRLDYVTAVMVHGYHDVAPTLSGGAVGRSPKEVAPTRLELKRKIQAFSEQIQKETGAHINLDVSWENLPSPEHDVLLNLRDLATAIQAALARVASDQFGKQALSEVRIFKFTHHEDEYPAIKRDGSVIELSINLVRALPQRLENELNEKLNGVL